MRLNRIYKVLGILFLTYISSCSVSYTFTGASIPLGAKTFTLYPVENVAPNVNISLAPLTHEKLIDKLLNQTSLNQVDFNGDLEFKVTITGYRITPIAIQGGDVSVAAQNRLTINVKAKYNNKFDNKANFEKSFSAYADYDSNLTFESVESELLDNITETICTKIFNEALANW